MRRLFGCTVSLLYEDARDPRRGAPEKRRDPRDALEGPFS